MFLGRGDMYNLSLTQNEKTELYYSVMARRNICETGKPAYSAKDAEIFNKSCMGFQKIPIRVLSREQMKNVIVLHELMGKILNCGH